MGPCQLDIFVVAHLWRIWQLSPYPDSFYNNRKMFCKINKNSVILLILYCLHWYFMCSYVCVNLIYMSKCTNILCTCACIYSYKSIVFSAIVAPTFPWFSIRSLIWTPFWSETVYFHLLITTYMYSKKRFLIKLYVWDKWMIYAIMCCVMHPHQHEQHESMDPTC